MDHSPEPWEVVNREHPAAGDQYAQIIDAQGNEMLGAIGYMYEGEFPDIAPENARRIVACVNACQGVPTEALEKAGIGGIARLIKAITEFTVVAGSRLVHGYSERFNAVYDAVTKLLPK